MVKLFRPPHARKSNKIKILKQRGSVRRASIRIPEKMLSEINFLLEQEGKTSYHKGKWISKSIISLYEFEDYVSLIDEEWFDRSNNLPVQIVLTEEAQDILNKIIQKLKDAGLERKDLISATIRVAITNALIKEGQL